MEKKPFVTKEQLDEIVKNTRHHFIYMMKRESVRMRKQWKRRLHGIRASANILR